jgi:hypothetical protein
MPGRGKGMKKSLLVIVLLLIGCAPWVQVGGLYKMEFHNYSVELPQGWMRWNKGDQLLITRDGVPLQNIQIIRRNIEEPLKYTKRKLSKTMLPQEAAEVILDNVASNKDISDFGLVENTPLRVSGISGFKAIYSYKTKDGLKVKSVYCGFIQDQWFYGINYNAPERHYFDKDITTFENVLESFKLIKTA